MPSISTSWAPLIARAIDGSRLVLIDGMGHDLPRDLWSRLIDLVEENTARARHQRAAA